ncbi:hypothetical protein AB0C91_10300 [Streptomyces sp. NPDC048674]|uniref:hypothetical protein n=1 Tax=Streptomyces sp. NPDC048674 TaxID=3155491 RepID=UPI003439BD22
MTNQAPWCCTGRVSECPLCPQYGTSLLDPCPGHPLNDNTQTAVDTARLHAERRHPGYEYATTTGPRKQWDDADVPPYGDNGEPDTTWQPNLDAGYPGAGWERFTYTEEAYWRRPKTAAAEPTATEAAHRHPRHGLSVQQEDALWDAVAIPGTETPTFMKQHDRVCRTVATLLLERPYQTVAGRCPACRWESLFLGNGGHVTCARDECPNPCAADQMLHGELQIPGPAKPASGSGPTVAEAAQDDRRWPLEKGGE